MYIPSIFLKIVTAALLSLLGIMDGQWTWNVGVSDADTDADASSTLA